ncbi:MAG TPA: VOC family protein [Gemmatimonadaceae bacterium]|nr:VOC family protein [Gemmatimonadaceae bacterium]
MTAPTAREGAAPFTVAPPRYRLPSDISLGRVRLQVADLARSVAYYERVVGFRTIAMSGSSAALGAHDDDTPLLELHERTGATPVPRRGRLGLFHFAILLPDRAALGRFVTHLASTGQQAGMADHLVSEAIYLSDPDGLGIEVYADRPRSEWRMQGRSIAMATLPLDVQNVARAAGGHPWTGAPQGTRIGHVHLHVSDLDQAAAFYHAGLGLDKVVVEFPGALFMSAGGYHHHLGTNTWAAGALPATDADARLLDWMVVLPSTKDVTEAAQSIAAAGFQVRSEGNDVVTADPWGTEIRLTTGERHRR